MRQKTILFQYYKGLYCILYIIYRKSVLLSMQLTDNPSLNLRTGGNDFKMASYFVHITSGPEQFNKVTLALLVAKTGVDEGHSVEVFFAADGVHLLNCSEPGQIVGEGTGDAFDYMQDLKASNTKLFVSRMSAEGRGYDDSLLDGFNASFATPKILLERSTAADVVLSY
jgi:predicted peroxiredoxin